MTGPGDESAFHARVADAVVAVPSYLDADALVAAATDVGRHAGPSRVRLPRGERRIRGVGDATRASTWVGPPADVLRRGGDKLEAKRIAAAAGVPTLPTGTSPRSSASPCSSRRPRAAAAVGCGSSRAPTTSPTRSSPPRARPRRRSATARSTASASCAAPDTSRCSCSVTGTGRCSPSARATARSSAATRRSSRSRRRRGCRRRCASGIAAHAVSFARELALRERRNRRVPRRGRRGVLPRAERPHPGRAPRDGGGDRPRPRRAPAARGRRRAARGARGDA